MFKKSIAIGKATGKGEWQKVLELAEEDDYTLIALAYERLEDIEKAKKYYHLALEEENNLPAIQQLSMIYAEEENYDEAYRYIKLGLLDSKHENNYIMKFISFFIDILKKILYPSYSFKKMREATKVDIQYSNDWIRWALEYIIWYESNIQK